MARLFSRLHLWHFDARTVPYRQMKHKPSFLRLALAALAFATLAVTATAQIKPVDSHGKPLNLDFEDGTLKDWTATGNAFDKQPVMGDAVAARRNDMKSGHQGTYWIGTYEVSGDPAQGTLTSV